MFKELSQRPVLGAVQIFAPSDPEIPFNTVKMSGDCAGGTAHVRLLYQLPYFVSLPVDRK
jgi:hypothetical protein